MEHYSEESDITPKLEAIRSGGWPKDELVLLLSSLPPEDEYHPLHNGKFIARHFPDSVHRLTEIVGDDKLDTEVRYHALIGILTYETNRSHLSNVRSICRKFAADFRNRLRIKLYEHLPLDVVSTVDEYLTSVEVVKRVEARMQNDPTVKCHLAELCVKSVEEFPDLPNRQTLLDLGRTKIDEAIDLLRYPKYFAVLGRILIQLGHFKEAKAEIRRAIDSEDARRPDYPLRIQEFRYHLLTAESRASLLLLEASVQKTAEQRISHEVEATKIRQIEILAFFASIMAWVVAGLNLASKYPMIEAAQLITLAGGVQCCVYVALCTAVSTKKNLLGLLVSGCLGIVLIFLGLHLGILQAAPKKGSEMQMGTRVGGSPQSSVPSTSVGASK